MKKLSLDELNRLDVSTFKEIPKNPICVVLDDIRSMNNVGSVFRTSDAFCIEKIYLCGITATPPHRDIEKTAIGATESVTWQYAEDALELCRNLQNDGWKIIAVEQVEGSVMLHKFMPNSTEKYALIVGNEVFGVQQELVNLADICLEIPQFGTKHSLNVAVSTGIVLWDLVSKMDLVS
jgi:23S rRNA (guanosine2251-2'-O)-methyltransferase